MARFRRRRPADLLYICEDDNTGYGDAADRLVNAVRSIGATVEYRGWANWMAGESPATKPCSRDSEPDRRAIPGAPTVAHLVPEHYPYVRQVAADGPLIGHTVWETETLPSHWPGLLNQVDHAIVPTEWNRLAFTDAGVTVPVSVVPHVIADVTGPSADLGLGLSDDLIVFTTIGRWDVRKAPQLAVRAFLRAFTGADPVVLVLKTGQRAEHSSMPAGPLHSAPALDIARHLREHPDPPRIHLAVGDWPEERIRSLHRRADCFVSLTHGEGWGLGLFDAVAHGCATITTGWGAPVEWMGPDATGLVGHELVAVEHAAADSYSPDQRWAEPDLDHAVELLRTVASDPVEARRQAIPVTEHVRATFTPAVVGPTFLSIVGDHAHL